MNLKNKKVIITGATGGIGNSLVKKFTDNGSIVLATGTKEEKLNNLKNKFSNIHNISILRIIGIYAALIRENKFLFLVSIYLLKSLVILRIADVLGN